MCRAVPLGFRRATENVMAKKREKAAPFIVFFLASEAGLSVGRTLLLCEGRRRNSEKRDATTERDGKQSRSEARPGTERERNDEMGSEERQMRKRGEREERGERTLSFFPLVFFV